MITDLLGKRVKVVTKKSETTIIAKVCALYSDLQRGSLGIVIVSEEDSCIMDLDLTKVIMYLED